MEETGSSKPNRFEIDDLIDSITTTLEDRMCAIDRIKGSGYGTEMILRSPSCGLACEVLRRELGARGINSRLIINEHPAGNAPGGHVLLSIDTDDGQLYADPTYSQFIREFGCDAMYIRHMRLELPEEKIITFSSKEVDIVVDLLTEYSHVHRLRNPLTQFVDIRGRNIEFKMYNSTLEEKRRYFQVIYDLSFYQPFILDSHVDAYITQEWDAYIDYGAVPFYLRPTEEQDLV